MNTLDCIKNRRSIRSYNDTPVSKELITEIIEAASYAPSWKNTQVTRYMVVTDPELKARVADECCSSNHNGGIIKQAPVLIITTMVRARSGYERDGSFSTLKEKGWQMYDCGIAGQTLCLAACEKGLSTLIMGIYDEEKITSLMNIPENQEVCALIALGYSDETPAAPKRKTTDELITFI